MQAITKPEAPIYLGREASFYCPDGRQVTIRETNGNDDEILSQISNSTNGDNIVFFLTDITLQDTVAGKKPTVEDILNWPSRTKWYVLFKQRIHTHGKMLEFDRTCPNEKCGETYPNVIDLEEDYDNDLTPGSDKYVQTADPTNRITLFEGKDHTEIQFRTSSGKEFKFKILTSLLERAALALPETALTQNYKLKIRELQVRQEDAWIPVTNFHAYSSREMGEIRAYIKKFDPEFEPIAKCKCPKCGWPENVPLFNIGNFYFPVPKI